MKDFSKLYRWAVLALGVFAYAFTATQPASAADEEPEPDRCPGQTLPVCREKETCIGIGGNTVCNTDYYYFPNP